MYTRELTLFKPEILRPFYATNLLTDVPIFIRYKRTGSYRHTHHTTMPMNIRSGIMNFTSNSLSDYNAND